MEKWRDYGFYRANVWYLPGWRGWVNRADHYHSLGTNCGARHVALAVQAIRKRLAERKIASGNAEARARCQTIILLQALEKGLVINCFNNARVYH